MRGEEEQSPLKEWGKGFLHFFYIQSRLCALHLDFVHFKDWGEEEEGKEQDEKAARKPQKPPADARYGIGTQTLEASQLALAPLGAEALSPLMTPVDECPRGGTDPTIETLRERTGRANGHGAIIEDSDDSEESEDAEEMTYSYPQTMFLRYPLNHLNPLNLLNQPCV